MDLVEVSLKVISRELVQSVAQRGKRQMLEWLEADAEEASVLGALPME